MNFNSSFLYILDNWAWIKNYVFVNKTKLWVYFYLYVYFIIKYSVFVNIVFTGLYIFHEHHLSFPFVYQSSRIVCVSYHILW